MEIVASQSGDFARDKGRQVAEALLQAHPDATAIYAHNDEMAMGAIETAKRRGLRVPLDLSVVGFDDIRFARCVDPPLTTVAQPMRAIGEGTVRLLLHILSGARRPPDSVTLPHTLTVRSTTAPPHSGTSRPA
jgi:LacI family repressor for deo operon, udp, cdd, tsx, nupC, and nupG